MMDRSRNISQERIKTAFISEALTRTAVKIRQEQGVVVDEWSLFDTGSLKAELQGHFDVMIGGPQVKLTMRNLAYLRFLDIKNPRSKIVQVKREGYHLYNRITYGNLYGYLLRQLRFGLTDDIKAQIKDLLAKSIE
jgi:hypothetical protein